MITFQKLHKPGKRIIYQLVGTNTVSQVERDQWHRDRWIAQWRIGADGKAARLVVCYSLRDAKNWLLLCCRADPTTKP